MAPHKEIEIKFRIPSIPALSRRLRAAGFRLVTRRTHEMNTLYDLPGQVLRQRGDLLRLRKYGSEWVLTHKAKGTAGRHKSRVETETKITDGKGLNDGPEYSPDGKYIFFNSTRGGANMQIYRMKPDGTDIQQLTNDDYNNWFPHISPDKKWISIISFPNDIDPKDHPFYKHVYLRLMPYSGGDPTVIAYLYGGQGTINVPSWSPDSKKLAFVSNTAGD